MIHTKCNANVKVYFNTDNKQKYMQIFALILHLNKMYDWNTIVTS